jgi:hypothetical protein
MLTSPAMVLLRWAFKAAAAPRPRTGGIAIEMTAFQALHPAKRAVLATLGPPFNDAP